MGKAIGLGLLAVVCIMALVVLIWGAATGFKYGTADIRGKVGLRELTLGSGDFRKSAYDHFYDLCAAIQGDEGRIKALKEELAGSVSQDRTEQINAFLSGIRGARSEKIARYNGDAAKNYTIGQFRDEYLPYHLDPDKEETKCVRGD